MTAVLSVSRRAPLSSMPCAHKMQTVPWETQWLVAMVLGVLLKKKNIKSSNLSCLVANRSTEVPDGPSSALFVRGSALQAFILGKTLQRPVVAGRGGAAGTGLLGSDVGCWN